MTKTFTQIFEEEKAFELCMSILPSGSITNNLLADNRWHIDCFRCTTCGTLLDSDSNVLLGNGSLICHACIHSHSVDNVKIEDLVVFIGDQAFFKCRNCNKKIENLRYARTSRGIFCLDCRDSSRQGRRRKASGKSVQREQETAQSLLTPQDPLSKVPAPSALSTGATLGSTSNTMTLASTPRGADLPTHRSIRLPFDQYIEEG